MHHLLTIATWNADVVEKKILRIYLTEHKFNVALIQETHFSNPIQDCRLPKYITRSGK